MLRPIHTFAFAVVGLAAMVPQASAHSQYVAAWISRYPTSTLDERMTARFGQNCYVCHQPEGYNQNGTCYRMDIKTRLDAGMTISQALAAVESLDSDGDGVSNRDEILMPRADLPGQIGYHPGRTGPLGVTTCATGAGTNTGVAETPPPAECAGDANGDRVINSADLSVMLGQFGQAVAPGSGADLNDDGMVDSADLSVLLARFGTSC